jgi:TonB family protein
MLSQYLKYPKYLNFTRAQVAKLLICGFFCFFSLIQGSEMRAQAPDDAPLNAAQTDVSENIEMPYFAGCQTFAQGSVQKRTCSNQNLVAYIAKNLETPKESELSGVVYISFSVDENGKVSETRVISGLSAVHDAAAIKVIAGLPAFEPAQENGVPKRTSMRVPIRFVQSDDSEFSNGFQLSWGNVKTAQVSKTALLSQLESKILVRDNEGNILEINELMISRERQGKFTDTQSPGNISPEMQRLVKKTKRGDSLILTATVQKKGQFYYVEKKFDVVE